MRRRWLMGWLMGLVLLPGVSWAVEAAPALTDREIVERLTRLEERLTNLEEGQSALRKDLAQLRADIKAQNRELRADMNEQNQQLRVDMNEQNRQLRVDMNLQFDRQFQLSLGLLGAFTALVGATIGFALWDRRTMLRPVEGRMKAVEADLAAHPPRALLEALRALGQRDPDLAKLLKSFNL